jgi:hypothetical protein
MLAVLRHCESVVRRKHCGEDVSTLTDSVPAMPMQALCTVCNPKPTVRLKCSLAVAVEVGSTHNGEQGRSKSALAYALRRLLQGHPCPPCDVPREIDIKPIERNTVMGCQHCGETRAILGQCLLPDSALYSGRRPRSSAVLSRFSLT